MVQRYTTRVGSESAWYVRPADEGYGVSDGTSYDNAWSGFSAISWESIKPGDTLYVAGQHFNPDSRVKRSGSANSPITIASCEIQYGASDEDPGEMWAASRQLASAWSGPNIDGLYYIVSSGYPTLKAMVEISAKRFVRVASDYSACVSTSNSMFYNSADSRLYYHPQGALVDVASGGYAYNSALRINSPGYTIDHVTVRGLSCYMGSTAGVLSPGRNADNDHSPIGLTLDNLTIGLGVYGAIPLGGDIIDFTMKNCVVSDCRFGTYYTSKSDRDQAINIFISKNEFYHSDTNRDVWKARTVEGNPLLYAPTDECALAVLGGVTNYEASGNYIHDWHGEGVYFFLGNNRSLNDAKIVRNQIFMETTDDKSTKMGVGIGGFNNADDANALKNVLIANNLIVGCQTNSYDNSYAAGIRYKNGTPTDPADTIKVYNNTFVDCYQAFCSVVNPSDQTLSVEFKNNIIVDPSDSGYFINVSNHTTLANATFDYNCYHGAGQWIWDGGSATSNFATWKTNTGNTQDANTITDDPLFVGSGNYSLQSGSPCVNTGTDTALTDDLAGNQRPVGVYDIGAYERQ